MPYKDLKEQKIKSKEHYEKYKEYYKNKAKEWKRIYNARNKKFVNRIKRFYGCSNCGYRKCSRALEFHHIESEDKDHSLGKLIISGCSLDKIKKELKKCVLLCSNCHRETHATKEEFF